MLKEGGGWASVSRVSERIVKVGRACAGGAGVAGCARVEVRARARVRVSEGEGGQGNLEG